MFGNLGNMAEMMKKANELRKTMQKLKEENYFSESNGVKVAVTGDMEIKEIKIDPKVVSDGNFGRLELCVKEALNKALDEAKKEAQNKIKGLTGGLSIPGLF
jgi:nucleoid-associated protein EbfC